MTALVIRADAGRLPLPDASVDLIVTSPPYFALRSYTDGGEHYAGQVGSEPTPGEYIDALLACTREWMRVLKPSGSCFVNLGDKYSGAQAQSIGGQNRAGDSARTWRQTDPRRTGIPNKSLMLLPERYRIGCVDQLGLIARAVLVWSKPNGLPESVTDRVRRSHEDWVHLVREPRYFSAVDAIREPHINARAGAALTWQQRRERGDPTRQGEQSGTFGAGLAASPLGKLPGSVWEVATEPLRTPTHRVVRNGLTERWFFSEADAWRYARLCGARNGRPSIRREVDHFAAMPTEWPRRLILGWSPSGICTACGEGRRPVVERTPMVWRASPTLAGRTAPESSRTTASGTMLSAAETRIIGEACACPDTAAPTRPSVILDPFGGTGTTALVASVLGRIGISVDLSADYCRLATWRTTDPGERAKAMRVPKPEKPIDGQLTMFDREAS